MYTLSNYPESWLEIRWKVAENSSLERKNEFELIITKAWGKEENSFQKMELIDILIYTFVEENASSLNFDIAVNDEIPSTVSQNVKPIEVMQKVVLPEFSELNELVMNNKKGYLKKRDSYHFRHTTTCS